MFIQVLTIYLFIQVLTIDLFIQVLTIDLFIQVLTIYLFIRVLTIYLFIRVLTIDLFIQVLTIDLFITVTRRYSRACGSYQYVHERCWPLTRKLQNSGFVVFKLKSSWLSFVVTTAPSFFPCSWRIIGF